MKYEYTTTQLQGMHPSSEVDKVMQAQGWHRAWADIDVSGTFIVYRREVKTLDLEAAKKGHNKVPYLHKEGTFQVRVTEIELFRTQAFLCRYVFFYDVLAGPATGSYALMQPIAQVEELPKEVRTLLQEGEVLYLKVHKVKGLWYSTWGAEP